MERLNRFLARGGVASRRASDRLIQSGEVTVNGRRVDQPGTLIDPEKDRVEVGGRRVRPPTVFCYVLLHKPEGYLVSKRDPHHSRTIFDLLAHVEDAAVSVGRLDLDTTGALLVTSDGELCHRLTHPRYEVEKTYRAVVQGTPDARALRRLREGVVLDDGPTAPARVTMQKQGGTEAVLTLTLHEGRKRQVKRMCEAVGHKVTRLHRSVFAGIGVEDLEPGKWRHLRPEEVERLRRMAGLVG